MTYYCSHITKQHEATWDALVARNSAGGFHQSTTWARFKQSQDWETYKIGLFNDRTNALVGGCVIHEFTFSNGTNFLYIPEGPILDFTDDDTLFWQWRALETAIHSIASQTKEMQTTHIRIEPRLTAVPDWFLTGFIKAPINLQPRHTQILTIDKKPDDLLTQMKPKGRYNIKLALKKGVQVAEVPFSRVNEFYTLYKKTFHRNKFEGKNVDFFKDYARVCHHQSKLFLATVDDTPVAGAITMYFGDRATYFYGASSDSHREYMAPYALHWHIIQDAAAHNYREYDWWGIARDEADTTHEWHGITRFKKQFGGHQLDLIGAYDYVLQEDLYAAFVKKHES